eukprot:Em0346g3a
MLSELKWLAQLLQQLLPASDIMFEFSGEVTDMSQAAVFPKNPVGNEDICRTRVAVIWCKTELPQPAILLDLFQGDWSTSTTAGPSGISAQHFATSACICASLKGAVNIRVSGKAPISVSSFLAGHGRDANIHLQQVITKLNAQISPHDAIAIEVVRELYTRDTGHVNSHFAVVLVQDWDRGKPAAFDVTVTSVLSSATIKEASAAVGAAAFVQPRTIAENNFHAEHLSLKSCGKNMEHSDRSACVEIRLKIFLISAFTQLNKIFNTPVFCEQATPNRMGSKILGTLSFTNEHKHFPVSLLRVSPTAIGLMAGGEPCLNLIEAVRLPLARNQATDIGALPAARRLTMSLSDEPMGIVQHQLYALQRLTPEDVANIIYLEGCTELQGKGAIEVFQQLQKKSGVAASYLESVSSIFHDIGRKDLALAGQSVPSDTKLILSAGACESGGKLLKGVTVESPLNVQTVRLLEFVSHQQLKDSASEYIFIKAGCKAISAFRFKETESPDPDDMGFLLIDKVDDHE